ncbi:hypothetical protein [Bosea sp. 685]|uniref:hypothetical protein n=1 Tax=Bosea sp. 685 TaxID=3080057 RepID=UPI0028932001|nr:hypothetical protein [Bosea sp. 685]WNJ89141.1 hypothetical protein RMR04_22380 [Bosea sp. 685]
MDKAQNEQIAAELNALSLATAVRAVEAIEGLQQRYSSVVALDIAVQALLTAAVSLLRTGEAQGFQVDVERAARAGIENILKLNARHHQRRPDGSFDPAGAAFN